MRDTRGGTARRRLGITAVLAWMGLLLPGPTRAQVELADFDYENLQFRGFAVEWGYIATSTRVEQTPTYSIRADLGYLGPGLRIVPSVQYWTSEFQRVEVVKLERRLERLVAQTGGEAVDIRLGNIEWSAISITVDSHVVWEVPFDILTHAGLGASLHLMNGAGDAIGDTFVEDLLDSVSPGGNLHLGLEYPLTDSFRLYGQGRGEVLGDLRYIQVKLGLQYTFGELMAGEERRR